MGIKSKLLTVVVLVLSSSANAAIIKFDFTATVTSTPYTSPHDTTAPHLLGGIPIGETINGSVTYSTNVSNSIELFPFQHNYDSEYQDYTYSEYQYTDGEFRISYNTSVGSFDTGSETTGRITVVNDMPGFACCDSSIVTDYHDSVTYQATSSEIYDNGSSGMYSLIHGDFRLSTDNLTAPARPDALTADQLPYVEDFGTWDNMRISMVEYRSLLDEEGVMYSHEVYRYWATVDSISVSAVPVPAAVWLFGSGLIGLVGVARRKKA